MPMWDYCMNARSGSATMCTPELFDKVIRMNRVIMVCAAIQDAREKVLRGEMSREDFETYKRKTKLGLPVFLFQAHFDSGKRRNADATSSGLSIFDIDHIQDPRGEFAQTIAPRVDALHIVLVHVTPSGEGLRLVFVMNEGETPATAQRRLAEQLQLKEFDESVKDLARCSFAVPEDYILYRNDAELFRERKFDLPKAEVKHGRTIGKPIAPRATKPSPTRAAKPSPTLTSDASASDHIVETIAGCDMKPIDSSDVNLRIFDLALKTVKLTPADIDVEGIYNWHASLLSVLSIGITKLMSIDDLLRVLEVRMPHYRQENDCLRLVSDYYQNYTDMNKPMTATLRYILSTARRQIRKGMPADATTAEDATATPIIDPEILPIGLKDSLAGIPKNMYMPVLCAVLPLAGAYADDVTVDYCDGRPHKLNLMSIIVGPQASGKSTCKNVIDEWARHMDEADQHAREIEDEYKKKKKNRRANERLDPEPEVLLRMPPVTISCSTLLKRLKNSQGHCLYSFGEELDTLRKSNSAGNWSSKYDVYRMAFDNGLWGQDYNSDQAESGVVKVAYNWSILGTYGALNKCFKGDNVENGLSSRIIVAEMPDNAFAKMPVYTPRTQEQNANIQRAVAILESKHGKYATPKINAAIEAWVEAKRVEAQANIDTVMDTYRKRAGVIGARCGIIAFLLSNDEETENVVNFAVMMADYVLDAQMRIFGEALELQLADNNAAKSRQGVNKSIFELLPEVFAFRDLQNLKPNSSYTSLRTIISRWKKDKWIKMSAKDQWQKIKGLVK